MNEGPEHLEDVPSEARESVLTTPADFGHAGQLGVQIRAQVAIGREVHVVGIVDRDDLARLARHRVDRCEGFRRYDARRCW